MRAPVRTPCLEASPPNYHLSARTQEWHFFLAHRNFARSPSQAPRLATEYQTDRELGPVRSKTAQRPYLRRASFGQRELRMALRRSFRVPRYGFWCFRMFEG